MTAQTINGKETAALIKERLKEEIAILARDGVVPGLTVILVGEDPASQVYVRNKARECEKLGMASEVIRLPETASEQELLRLIGELNRNERVHGILVQLPLPGHISEKAVIDAISVEKDVDGFHPVNVGNLLIGGEGYLPCTPAGVIELIKRTGIAIAGRHAVVVGRSNIVGKPVSLLLLRENATVTICHSRTANMEDITRQADILVVAVGKAKMIGARHVKPGAVVIDVGVNRLEDGTLAGDVDFDEVKEIAGHITPVPGGVGPMTIAMLLSNTLESARKFASVKH
ncbi:bifunctional methylenetetrahydrofolate dehydrogenase/methenyltetrahydrofolate cyclohydrolase FolD [Ferviditalea candida]|uniref:Bifunctional protein FolD n=1 Tax=Ferviditalea candida TaxID=3108399 RepID=A0ABU5ZG00_9BACL|nr:bifunctional methylenetetrahydrofolate dehydrogenase/methenyltetrahydrofolate cyclohydrolase FolD [Paenibacillaceae bacterium T2]